MRTFRLELKTSVFQYLWLKSVHGFDQRFHCAKCLAGTYSKLIDWRRPGFKGHLAGFKAEGMLEPSPFLYLCGVSTNGWEDNLHVAGKLREGGIIAHEDHNCSVLITGFERVSIPPVPGANGVIDASYSTCRNWQFGWWYFPSGRRPFDQAPGLIDPRRESEEMRRRRQKLKLEKAAGQPANSPASPSPAPAPVVNRGNIQRFLY